MSTLSEIVKHVMVIIVITSFLELMLPEGGIKPFVRFAIGLFIIITVLNPVLGLLFQDHKFEIKWWDGQIVADNQERVERDGKLLKEQIVNVNNHNLKEKLEGQINSLAQLVPGVGEVKTTAELNENGELKAICLRVKEEAATANEEDSSQSSSLEKERDKDRKLIKNKISDLLNNFYGLQGVKMEFVFEGG